MRHQFVRIQEWVRTAIVCKTVLTAVVCLQAPGDRQNVVVAEALALLSAMTDAGWVRRRSLLAVLAADSARVPLPFSCNPIPSPPTVYIMPFCSDCKLCRKLSCKTG